MSSDIKNREASGTLKKKTVFHDFSDGSGTLIYNTISDESVLLGSGNISVQYCEERNVWNVVGDAKIIDELHHRGFFCGH